MPTAYPSSEFNKPAQQSLPQSEPQAPQNPADRYAATAWGGGEGIDLQMPSGQLALVRKPSIESLISAGVLHSMDTLTPAAQSLLKQVEGASNISTEQVEKLMEDPKVVDDMLHIVDKIVCHVVIKPQVQMTPNDATAREPGVIYTDMIDLADRMFILQYTLQGQRDLAPFRDESAPTVGGLESLQGDGGSSFGVPVHP